MELNDVRKQIDEYFSKVTPKEVVKMFEDISTQETPDTCKACPGNRNSFCHCILGNTIVY